MHSIKSKGYWQVAVPLGSWKRSEALFGTFGCKYDVYPDLMESGGLSGSIYGKWWGLGGGKGETKNTFGGCINDKKLDSPFGYLWYLIISGNFKAFMENQGIKAKHFVLYGGLWLIVLSKRNWRAFGKIMFALLKFQVFIDRMEIKEEFGDLLLWSKLVWQATEETSLNT